MYLLSLSRQSSEYLPRGTSYGTAPYWEERGNNERGHEHPEGSKLGIIFILTSVVSGT